ncbi:MAG: hypothetical protein REI93_04990, partial [Pedobacter sp.]|nr:hypothetical protein [Pedobacter sp.]
MANAPKPTTVKKESSSASNLFATLVIPICIIIGITLFIFVLGKPSNFNIPEDVAKANSAVSLAFYDGDTHAYLPHPGNYGGMAYKGGFIVPILMGMLLMVFVFSIERLIVIGKATGKGSLDVFVK